MKENLKITKEEVVLKLQNELKELNQEISKISIVDDGKNVAIETNTHSGVMDQTDQASEMINIHNNDAVLFVLEERKNNIEKALKNSETDNFGKCDVCEKDIEVRRLLANSAAMTCTEHMN